MKLICAVTYVSLFLQVQCARLAYSTEKAKNTREALPQIEDLVIQHASPWRVVNNCCHLPKDKQDCSCCKKACIPPRQTLLPQRTCCHLPKILQNCYCCSSSCSPPPPPPRKDCCLLPKRFLSCGCCPAACLPAPLLPLSPLPLSPLPKLPSLLPPPPIPQQPSPRNCCNVPKPFLNCQCCPSACQQPPPLPTPINNKNTTPDASNNCCRWFKALQNCNCCPQACEKKVTEATQPTEIETTTQTLPVFTTKVTKAPNDCCHFPVDLQNCNCCPSLCQETTTYTETPTPFLPDNCCDRPKDQQRCSCCTDACGEKVKDKPSPTTTVITITTPPETDSVVVAEIAISCCHLQKEFRTCKCCPGNCDAPAELLHYENCCNWPKVLQRCDCCPYTCQNLQSNSQLEEANNVVEDCCKASFELQDCQCCPTSRYCKLATSQRRSLQLSPFRYLQALSSSAVPLKWPKSSRQLILPRFRQREFAHRPETYPFGPTRKTSSIMGSMQRRTLPLPTGCPWCASSESNVLDNDISAPEFPYTALKNYAHELRPSQRRTFAASSNGDVYDYYYNSGKSTGGFKKNNKQADGVLPSRKPFIGHSVVKIAYRSLMDHFAPPALKDVHNRAVANRLTDPNNILELDGLDTLDDVISKIFEFDLNDTTPTFWRTETKPIVKFNYRLFPKPSRFRIPALLANLMLAHQNFRPRQTLLLKKSPTQDFLVDSKRYFGDNPPYSSIIPTLPSEDLPSKEQINYLAHKILFNVENTGNRQPRYYPVHLATPVQNMKEVITRNAIIDRYINRYPFDVQQLGNLNQELLYPTISNSPIRFYNSIDLDDFNYMADVEDDNEFDDDDYIAVVGNENIELIPLKYSQGSSSLITEPIVDPVQPWKNSNDNSDLMREASNIIFADGDGTDEVDLDPTENVYGKNDLGLYDDLKMNSAPPKSWYNPDIVDGLAKIATGFEVNHGEVEFEANEDYSDSNPPDPTRVSYNADDILERLVQDSLSQMPDEDVLGMLPWLDRYGVAKYDLIRRSSRPYFPKRYVDYPINFTPINNVGMVKIANPDEVVQNGNDIEGLKDNNNKNNYPFVMLPILGSWADDAVGYNAIAEEYLSRNGFDRHKPMESTTKREANSERQMGLSGDDGNLSPSKEFNTEKETMGQRKRDIRSYKRIDPLEGYYFKTKNLFGKGGDRRSSNMRYARASFQVRDAIVEQMFHRLKRLLSMPRSRKMAERRLDQLVPSSNWPQHNKNSDGKKDLAHSLLRSSWYPSTQFQKELDVKPIDQSSFRSNSWPIAYGQGDVKTLEMPVSSVREDDEAGAPIAPSSAGRKNKSPVLKENQPQTLKNQESEERARLPLVVILSHYVPIVRPLTPIDSYLPSIDFYSNYPLINKVPTTCQEPQTETNRWRMLNPEMDRSSPVVDLDIPVNDDGNKNDAILRRVARTSVEDDIGGDINGEVKGLKPGCLHRIGLDPAAKQEDTRYYDIKKIILEPPVSSRTARNDEEEDGNKEIVIGVEEPPLWTKYTGVESDGNLQVSTTANTNAKEESTTEDGNVEF